MSWFFSRRKPQGEKSIAHELVTGDHRSPGLAVLCQRLKERRPEAILDLGASTTETVSFLSGFCDNVTIAGLFRDPPDEAAARSTLFRFDESALHALPPKKKAVFDVVLMWDLLHYFEQGACEEFIARLAQLCRPDALIYLIASNNAPIPLTPISFRIEKTDYLHYDVPSKERAQSPQLRTRDVELLMSAFRPQRLFQLRNGLQEFIFTYEGPAEAEPERAAGSSFQRTSSLRSRLPR